MKQICKECLEDKELSEYYKHPEGKNGVLGRCKECIKKGRRSDRERLMARKWEKLKMVRPEGYTYNRTKKYRKEHRYKYLAHQKVNNFLSRHKGIFNFKCSICNSSNTIELHHEDYSKQNEIIPFCSLHHKRYHCGDFKINNDWKIILPF